MWQYILIMVIAQALASVSQLLLKVGAERKQKSNFVVSFLNIYTISGYFMFLCITIMTTYSMKYIPIKYSCIFTPMTTLFVCILSYLILKEKFNKVQLIGIMLTIIGIMVFLLKI